MENFELKAIAFEEDGKGHEEFLAGEYDTGEFSLANYLALKSRGEPLMDIPVFPNRKFRLRPSEPASHPWQGRVGANPDGHLSVRKKRGISAASRRENSRARYGPSPISCSSRLNRFTNSAAAFSIT
jgi:hypothetical protein